MTCNFCGKTLDACDETNLGNLELPFFYGSKRDGDYMKFSLCSGCYDKLADEFMSDANTNPSLFPLPQGCQSGNIRLLKNLIIDN